jgi:hypothetical protein
MLHAGTGVPSWHRTICTVDGSNIRAFIELCRNNEWMFTVEMAFGTENERADFGLAPTHPAGVRSEARGEVSLVSHHAVGSMGFSVVPDLFCRIELGGIRRELL